MAILFNRLYVIFIIIIFLSTAGIPQPEELYFENLSTQDGLSNDIIMSIIQDSRGFMWFGTFDGLNRYNPKEDNFTRFYFATPQDSTLSYHNNNLIIVVTGDTSNRLPIATLSELVRFDPRTGETVSIEPTVPVKKKSDYANNSATD
ncbi:hypothetical protein EH222_13055 [candidate division KSB1 bacterium]|nr:MAG: hypothetical protein EH222_13055 [candidate division KSB1 bacterium]